MPERRCTHIAVSINKAGKLLVLRKFKKSLAHAQGWMIGMIIQLSRGSELVNRNLLLKSEDAQTKLSWLCSVTWVSMLTE